MPTDPGTEIEVQGVALSYSGAITEIRVSVKGPGSLSGYVVGNYPFGALLSEDQKEVHEAARALLRLAGQAVRRSMGYEAGPPAETATEEAAEL